MALTGLDTIPPCVGSWAARRLTAVRHRPARWAGSRPSCWRRITTSQPFAICPVPGSTGFVGASRRSPSCSTWTARSAPSMAGSRARPTTAISAAPAIIRCSCSTGSATWSAALCAPATCTVLMAGEMCWIRRLAASCAVTTRDVRLQRRKIGIATRFPDEKPVVLARSGPFPSPRCVDGCIPTATGRTSPSSEVATWEIPIQRRSWRIAT